MIENSDMLIYSVKDIPEGIWVTGKNENGTRVIMIRRAHILIIFYVLSGCINVTDYIEDNSVYNNYAPFTILLDNPITFNFPG